MLQQLSPRTIIITTSLQKITFINLQERKRGTFSLFEFWKKTLINEIDLTFVPGPAAAAGEFHFVGLFIN